MYICIVVTIIIIRASTEKHRPHRTNCYKSLYGMALRWPMLVLFCIGQHRTVCVNGLVTSTWTPFSDIHVCLQIQLLPMSMHNPASPP